MVQTESQQFGGTALDPVAGLEVDLAFVFRAYRFAPVCGVEEARTVDVREPRLGQAEMLF